MGVAGRCIGRTDVAVDRRKAKRLAHRIRQRARRDSLPLVVWTSPLRRSAAVGRCLRRWGWQHRVDVRLSELDFGEWDGRAWNTIGEAELSAWTATFATHAPGGGESVAQLTSRCEAFLSEQGPQGACVVSHAGWINAALRVAGGLLVPTLATQWPAAVAYAASVDLPIKPFGAESQ